MHPTGAPACQRWGLALSLKCGAPLIPSPERAAQRVWRKQARKAGFTVGADRPTGRLAACGRGRGGPRVLYRRRGVTTLHRTGKRHGRLPSAGQLQALSPCADLRHTLFVDVVFILFVQGCGYSFSVVYQYIHSCSIIHRTLAYCTRYSTASMQLRTHSILLRKARVMNPRSVAAACGHEGGVQCA